MEVRIYTVKNVKRRKWSNDKVTNYREIESKKQKLRYDNTSTSILPCYHFDHQFATNVGSRESDERSIRIIMFSFLSKDYDEQSTCIYVWKMVIPWPRSSCYTSYKNESLPSIQRDIEKGRCGSCETELLNYWYVITRSVRLEYTYSSSKYECLVHSYTYTGMFGSCQNPKW